MSESSTERKFWGKYRGTVAVNVDPELRGRLMCFVPDVLGPVPSSWCEACTPLGGPPGPPMGVYMVPPIGVLAGAFMLGETVTPGMIIGGTLIMAGVAIAQFGGMIAQRKAA